MRYNYYLTPDKKTICTSTYAGKIVRGTAKCAPDTEFSEGYGMMVAKAKVDLKIAERRFRKIRAEAYKAEKELEKIQQYALEKSMYLNEVYQELVKARETLKQLVESDEWVIKEEDDDE